MPKVVCVTKVRSVAELVEKVPEMKLVLATFHEFFEGEGQVSPEHLFVGTVVQKYYQSNDELRICLAPCQEQSISDASAMGSADQHGLIKLVDNGDALSKVIKVKGIIGLAGFSCPPRRQDRIANREVREFVADTKSDQFKLFVIDGMLPTKASAKIEPNYMYTKLKDLEAVKRLHCFGVVHDFRTHKKDNQDSGWKVTLVDETTDVDAGVNFLIVARNAADLPRIERNGDILRLHRVTTKLYDDKVEGWGTIGVVGFHVLVFSGLDGTAIEPRGNAGFNYTLDDGDRERVKALRLWYIQQRRFDSEAGTSAARQNTAEQTFHSLQDLKPMKYINLVAEVLGVFDAPVKITGVPCAVVRVWDGSRPERSVGCSEPYATMIDLVEVQRGIYAPSMSKWAVSHGLAVDIFVYDEHQAEAYKLKVGAFALFNNLHSFHPKGRSAFHNGLLEDLVIHGGPNYNRHIRRLPDNHKAVRAVRERMEQVSCSGDYETQVIGDYDELMAAFTKARPRVQHARVVDPDQCDVAGSRSSPRIEVFEACHESPAHIPWTSNCMESYHTGTEKEQETPRPSSPCNQAALRLENASPTCSPQHKRRRSIHASSKAQQPGTSDSVSNMDSSQEDLVFPSEEMERMINVNEDVLVDSSVQTSQPITAACTSGVTAESACDCARLHMLEEGCHDVLVRVADYGSGYDRTAWSLLQWCCTRCGKTTAVNAEAVRDLALADVTVGRRCEVEGCSWDPDCKPSRLQFVVHLLVGHDGDSAMPVCDVMVVGQAAEKLLGTRFEDIWDNLRRNAMRTGRKLTENLEALVDSHLRLKLTVWKCTDGNLDFCACIV